MKGFPRATALACFAVHAICLAAVPAAANDCGEVVTLRTHGDSTTRYAFAAPKADSTEPRFAVVLLPGGGGHVDLDDKGCARSLTGNSLVRSLTQFHAEGLATALVDAPSDYPGEDGLAGFRTSAEHAEELGKVIADVRARSNAQVCLVGTSRGSISAANAAARLTGPAAPDGVVLTSAVSSGGSGGQKPWVRQTVFDVRLADIRVPALVVGHAHDACIRSPASLMGDIAARIGAARKQVVTVTGGPSARSGVPGVGACAGLQAHGFIEQEAEVAAGIVRFIRGGSYQP